VAAPRVSLPQSSQILLPEPRKKCYIAVEPPPLPDGRRGWLRVLAVGHRSIPGCTVPRGRSKKARTRVPVAVYLPNEFYARLKKRAEKEHRSLSRQVVLYIERGLKESDRRSP
jgi:CopG-like RHH_1 or ribbon-helix-helix domain, RHH_5